jgi:hypothetical protein
MPNWCENGLYISGQKEEITRFKNQAVDNSVENKTALSLAKFLPVPEELQNEQSPSRNPNPELIEKYGYSNWYDWSIGMWGTKWDVEAELVDETETLLVYRFSSAWSPPIEWLEAVSKMFPTLAFKMEYEEGGVGFKGEAEAVDGQLTDFCEDMTEEDYQKQEMEAV